MFTYNSRNILANDISANFKIHLAKSVEFSKAHTLLTYVLAKYQITQ